MTHSPQPPAQVYTNLRQAILTLDPLKAGMLVPSAAPHVWGCLVESRYDETIVTLVCLADGTTSLYFSTGGGILGCGQHPTVAQAAQAVIAASRALYPALAPAEAFPLPPAGYVQLILLALDGCRSGAAPEPAVYAGQHPLSPLFGLAQEVLAQIRLLSDAPQAG